MSNTNKKNTEKKTFDMYLDPHDEWKVGYKFSEPENEYVLTVQEDEEWYCIEERAEWTGGESYRMYDGNVDPDEWDMEKLFYKTYDTTSVLLDSIACEDYYYGKESFVLLRCRIFQSDSGKFFVDTEEVRRATMSFKGSDDDEY